MSTRIIPLAIITLVLIAPVLSALTAAAQEKTGPASEYLIFKRVPMEQVVEAIKSGDIDVYIFGLKPSLAQQLVGVKGVKLYTAPSGLVDLILNPAPVAIVELKGKYTKEEAAKLLGVPEIAVAKAKYDEEKGVTVVDLCVVPEKTPPDAKVKENKKGLLINPFCFREIRFAMNYIVDRGYIVNTIYRGFAIPMYAAYSPADPTYTSIVDIIASFKFTYNPAYVESVVEKVMKAVGAEKKAGVWYYKGKPVTIYGIVRVEDERREIGDSFAAALKKLGFNVVVEHLTFRQAIPKVYFTDPFDFEWSFYTEGWGKGVIDRWDPWIAVQFCAPWFGFMPGWQESGYWQYEQPKIDELTQIAALGKFKSKEEFINCIREAIRLCQLDAIRIWIATTLTIYPARADLKGVTIDLGAGLRSPFNGREWYIPGKDTVVVGHMWVYTEGDAWNTFGGFESVYSVDIERLTVDPFIWRHPFNGEPIPFRVTYEVRTAGPTGTLEVPDDAVWWDAKADKWVPAKELGRTKAKSVVIFDLSKLVGSKWHHGITISLGDWLARLAAILDVIYDPEKSKLESSIASTNKDIYDKFVAIRVLPDEKKVEIYVDYWHFDPNYIADFAVVNLRVPAEITIMQDYLAFVKKTYALSKTRSRAQKLPWLDLVLKEQTKDFIEALKELKDKYDMYKSYFTVGGKTFISKEEWEKRIDAAIAWIEKYGNAWISDGPFMLVEFDKDKQIAKLKAFRDPTYPFKPGDWYFGEPKKTVITNVMTPIVAPGKPAAVTVYVKGIPPIKVLWLLRDPVTGKILGTGEAKQTPAGTYLIELPAELTSKLAEYSAYELTVIAYSEKVTLPYEYVVTLQTGAKPAAAAAEEAVKAVEKEVTAVREQVKSITEQVTVLQSRLKTLEESLESLKEALGKQTGQLGEVVRKSLATLSDTVTSLASTVSKFGSMVEQMSKSVDKLASRIQELSSKLSEEVGKAKESAEKASGEAKKIKESIEDLSDRVAKLESTVASLNTMLMLVLVLVIVTLAVAALGLKRR